MYIQNPLPFINFFRTAPSLMAIPIIHRSRVQLEEFLTAHPLDALQIEGRVHPLLDMKCQQRGKYVLDYVFKEHPQWGLTVSRDLISEAKKQGLFLGYYHQHLLERVYLQHLDTTGMNGLRLVPCYECRTALLTDLQKYP
jgi:hypothetical protein